MRIQPVRLENVNRPEPGALAAPNGRSFVRRLVRDRVTLVCCYYIVDDWFQGRRLARGDIGSDSGTHPEFDSAAMVSYGTQVWSAYCELAGGHNFTGRVAEIGPGGNDVVAWHLLARGAAEVHLVDRFAQNGDPGRAGQIRAIAARDPAISPILTGQSGDPAGLYRHIGQAAEEFFVERTGAFDAILSRAVLEHVMDPIAALTTIARALRPGAVMVHTVDLRDHAMFKGQPPLTFLTVPGSLWPTMTANSGRPNRVTFSQYREWLAGSGLEGSLTINMLAGSNVDVELAAANDAPEPLRATAFAEVAKVRPKLSRALRNESDADLAVSSFTLVARRPI